MITILIMILTMIINNNSANTTPSPPTKGFPTKSPRVELSGRLPIKLYGHENSHPLKFKSLLESNLLKPELLVGGLGVGVGPLTSSQERRAAVLPRINRGERLSTGRCVPYPSPGHALHEKVYRDN